MHITTLAVALIGVALIRIYLPSEEEVKNPLIVAVIVLIRIVVWLIQLLLPFLLFYLIIEALFELLCRTI